MSAYDPEYGPRPTATQLVADFLATFAIFAALIAIVVEPGKLATAAVFISLFAATLGGRDRHLVPASVVITTVCWFLGMTLAIVLDRPIF
jgi:hypothetical protein